MSFIDLYHNGSQERNLAHFAAIATLAAVDGAVNLEEKKLLDSFAHKLNITEEEYREVMKVENKYPIDPPVSSEERLERLYDLFKMIFADSYIDDPERNLITKYAIGLGYSPQKADEIIQKSINIFSGRIDYEDYLYLLRH